ncbi:hypothetical protein AVDCRST_MAG84-719 [uncultured Microcoleus sp.]|uniref:Uncharacterized protein n=1 Tax=uncultured Microcoleus sp. TaxID=259945 RepID=A0A6J4KN08_9CYAN|nr:hypothetical protein AVDCRST_MAG84-719 [uncultured Microcoleus sp.]
MLPSRKTRISTKTQLEKEDYSNTVCATGINALREHTSTLAGVIQSQASGAS